MSDPFAIAIIAQGTETAADPRPTEEIAFYYNKIAFSYAKVIPGEIKQNL